MEFVLERYNYWIIILLMMGGLYIVFEAENTIKKLVGLGIFQTSVLFFYVTLGKTAGGTAPILVGDAHGHHGDEHHGEAAGHSAAAASSAHSADHETEHAASDHHDDHLDAEKHVEDAHVAEGAHDLDVAGHDVHVDTHASDHAADAAAAADHASDAAHGAVSDALHMAGGDVIYSNPLPHVLMLTAIVVGVATLSVGLSLVVRIREAYGTIEMDEVRGADIAESEAEGEAA